MDKDSRDPRLILPQDIQEKLNDLPLQTPFTDQELDDFKRRIGQWFENGFPFLSTPRPAEEGADSPYRELPLRPSDSPLELETLPFIPSGNDSNSNNIELLGDTAPNTFGATESSIRITFPPLEETPELDFSPIPEHVEPPINRELEDRLIADVKPTLVEYPADSLEATIKSMDIGGLAQPPAIDLEALDPKYNRYSEADPAAFIPNPQQPNGQENKPEAPVDREQEILQTIKNGCEAMVKLAELGEEIHKQISQLLDKDGSLARIARQKAGGQAAREGQNEQSQRQPRDEFEREFDDFRRRHAQKAQPKPKGNTRRKA